MLTAKGSRTLADLTERVAEVERELLVDLTATEGRQLRELLGRVATSAAAGGPGVSACTGADDRPPGHSSAAAEPGCEPGSEPGDDSTGSKPTQDTTGRAG